MKVTFSPTARDDLVEIALYIVVDNASRALTFVDELESKCASLGVAPGIGTSRPELGEGFRMLPYGRYLIFYRPSGKTLRIERIMHSARDIGAEDFDLSANEEGA